MMRKAKVLRRELKQSSFKRSFTLGELLDGDDISANFQGWCFIHRDSKSGASQT